MAGSNVYTQTTILRPFARFFRPFELIFYSTFVVARRLHDWLRWPIRRWARCLHEYCVCAGMQMNINSEKFICRFTFLPPTPLSVLLHRIQFRRVCGAAAAAAISID